MPQLTNRRHCNALFMAVLLISVLTPPSFGQDSGKMLKGGVNASDWLKPNNGPSLSRTDIRQKGDPFGSGRESGPGASEQFDAPEAAFGSQQQAAPSPPFNLQADEGGFGNQDATMAQPPQEAPQMGGQQMLPPPQQQMQAMDPEQSGQMKLAWDEWHRRVAEAIFVRFDALANKAFPSSRPLGCQVVYTVTRDHQITNVRVIQKSPNIVFNSMIMLVLKSMNGSPVLEFPPGTRRMSVEKLGNFTRNYGVQGFKHTINDNELIKQQQHQPQMNMGAPQNMQQMQMQQMQMQLQQMTGR